MNEGASGGRSQGLIDVFFRPDNNFMVELPPYAQQDWCWWLRFMLTSVGMAFLAIDINRQVTGESLYPLPRTRLFGAFKAMQAVLLNKGGYLQLPAHPAYGVNTPQNFPERCKRAMYGALIDLTEFKVANRDIDELNSDSLWPTHSAFPDMAANALNWSQYDLYDQITEAELRRQDQIMAEKCSVEFSLPINRALEFRDLTLKWMDDLDELIESSNRTRPSTRKYRKWEVGNTPDTFMNRNQDQAD